MNEQIEHCLYQAGLTAQGCWDELDDYAKQSIEKFAELIIKECIGIIEEEITEQQTKKVTTNFDAFWIKGKIEHFNTIKEKIAQRFGVE